MAGSQRRRASPTKLSLAQFEAFVLPHLSVGSRGPAPKLGLHKVFNYILCVLYLGCQWKELPIEKDRQGLPEIHYTRVYRARMAVSPPFSPARCANFMRTGCSISASFTA